MNNIFPQLNYKLFFLVLELYRMFIFISPIFPVTKYNFCLFDAFNILKICDCLLLSSDFGASVYTASLYLNKDVIKVWEHLAMFIATDNGKNSAINHVNKQS